MHERRHAVPGIHQMREQLNGSQREVLRVLEYFGWQLHFVRHTALHDPLPVIHAEQRLFAVIRPDGSVDDESEVRVRH